MTTGATLVRYEQPSEGSASPPLAEPTQEEAIFVRRVMIIDRFLSFGHSVRPEMIILLLFKNVCCTFN